MSMLNKQVIIRTINSGVHYGTLVSHQGQEAVLIQARRIWYWEGAFTLSAVATKGISKKSKVSVLVPEILLTDVIEIIPCTPEAAECLSNIPAHLE